MQNRTMSVIKGAVTGLAVGTVVMLASNSKLSAGASLRKNVKSAAKSVSRIADSVKTLVS